MHIDILIDASGSMGFMEGSEYENKYLIDGKHTRTDLVKNILENNLIEDLDFTETISIECFLNKKQLNSVGKPIIKDNHYIESPNLINHFSGNYDKDELISAIKKIENPEIGGTPLRWCLLYKVNKSTISNHHIIVFSDGEGNLDSKVDDNWNIVVLDLLRKLNKNIIIHFIGIAQTEDAELRCKNICSQTNGTYINLASINYEPSELNSLLFNLKSNITSSAINDNNSSNSHPAINTSKQVAPFTEVHNHVINLKEPETIQTDLELQVKRNTKSLELITNQLENIVKLLLSKSQTDEEVFIDENTELNLKIGRLAEEYLYSELLKNKWDINWLNQDGEKFMPYDFEIKVNNDVYYYECKGTTNNLNEFLLTKNEWLFYLKNKERYRLCLVNNVLTNPSYIRLTDLFEEMKSGKLIPCSNKNIKLKADRLFFTYSIV